MLHYLISVWFDIIHQMNVLLITYGWEMKILLIRKGGRKETAEEAGRGVCGRRCSSDESSVRPKTRWGQHQLLAVQLPSTCPRLPLLAGPWLLWFLMPVKNSVRRGRSRGVTGQWWTRPWWCCRSCWCRPACSALPFFSGESLAAGGKRSAGYQVSFNLQSNTAYAFKTFSIGSHN